MKRLFRSCRQHRDGRGRPRSCSSGPRCCSRKCGKFRERKPSGRWSTPRLLEEKNWKSYVEGRILLLREQPDSASARDFRGARPEPPHEALPESLLVAATFGLADSIIALKGSGEGDQPLEEFIHQHPTSAYLDRVFRRLDEVYAMEEDPPDEIYRRWLQMPQVRRAALARFYLGKMQAREGKTEKALAAIDYFVRTYPEHPLIAEACLLQSELLSRKKHFAEASRALDGAMRHAGSADTRAEIELLSGLINYRQGRVPAQLPRNSKQPKNVPLPCGRWRPLMRRSPGWLNAISSVFAASSSPFRSFSRLHPFGRSSCWRKASRRPEPGFRKRRRRWRDFCGSFPRIRAPLRLGWHWPSLRWWNREERGSLHTQARSESGQYLRTVAAAAPTPDVRAHADYLAIWLADAQESPNDESAIVLARAFLTTHPQSEWVPPVRMKLGQFYFNREDYANAETYFAKVARDSPASALAESALFLAGQSAAKLMNPGAIDRALAYFDAVVQRDGPLKLYARQEQAIIQSKLSHEDQALALYDLILNAVPPPDMELRQATICGKGDGLLNLGRREGAKDRMTAAITVYNELASLPGVTPVWRNQALFKKGKALEQLGRNDEAIVAYYDVLNRSASGDREYFWLYKAGFDAARLLEQQEQWKSAVGIYEKMAAFSGPRSPAARARAKQLRLEHYLLD